MEVVYRLRARQVADTYTEDPWDLADEEPMQTLAPAEPRPSGEPVQDARNAVTSGYTLYLPESSDVTSKDRMRVRDRTYDVLGEPAVWAGAGMVVQCSAQEG